MVLADEVASCSACIRPGRALRERGGGVRLAAAAEADLEAIIARTSRQSRRPIRVWYNNNTGCGGGEPKSSGVGFGLPGVVPPFCTGGSFDTLLMYGATRSITSAVVVIDDRQVKSLTFRQMADYVALVSLAEVRLDPARAPRVTTTATRGHCRPRTARCSGSRIAVGGSVGAYYLH